jgi:hypothetical protein
MKKGILLAVVILLNMAGFVQAQEGELHGTIGITYDSKYIWRGFDIYGDKSAIHPFIDLDLYGTGFGINVTAHRANSSGYENGERWDYTAYYRGGLFEDEAYATNYMIGYRYYNYPDMSSHTTGSIDLQEIHTVFSWPKILGVERLVPSYVLVKLWPSNSGTVVGAGSPSGGTASGWAHIFMLDYGLPIEGLLPEFPGQILNLHTEMVYNDGVHPGGGNADHDWSNIVFGVSTDFEVAENLTFTPGVYHQITMDNSVNPDDDETWVSLCMKYSF